MHYVCCDGYIHYIQLGFFEECEPELLIYWFEKLASLFITSGRV